VSPRKGFNVVYDGDDQAPRLMMVDAPADDTESVTVTLRNPTSRIRTALTVTVNDANHNQYTLVPLRSWH
jgi:hypothetical protein